MNVRNLFLLIALTIVFSASAAIDGHTELTWAPPQGSDLKIWSANWTNEVGEQVKPVGNEVLYFTSVGAPNRVVCAKNYTAYGVIVSAAGYKWNSQSLLFDADGLGLSMLSSGEFRLECHFTNSGELPIYIAEPDGFVRFNQTVKGSGRIVKTGPGYIQLTNTESQGSEFSGEWDISGGGCLELASGNTALGTAEAVAKFNAADGSILKIDAANVLNSALAFTSPFDRGEPNIQLPAAEVTLNGGISLNEGGGLFLSVPAKGTLTVAGALICLGAEPCRFVLRTDAATATASVTSELAMPNGSVVELQGDGANTIACLSIAADETVTVSGAGLSKVSTLTIGAGGRIALPFGTKLKADKVVYDGSEIEIGKGIYCATDGFGDFKCAWIEGEGVICNALVDPPETVEELVLDADRTLDFSTHQEYSSVLGTAEASATLSGNGCLYLSAMDVVTAGTGCEYVFAVQTMLRRGGTIDVGAGDTVRLTERIESTDSSLPIVKTGPGTLSLEADNAFANPVIVSNGVVEVWKDKSFGFGAVQLCGSASTNVFRGVEIDNAVSFVGGTINGLSLSEGTTNVFNGVVKLNKNRLNLKVPASSKVVFNGGLPDGGYCGPSGGGTLELRGTVVFSDRFRIDNGTGNNLTIRLYTSGASLGTINGLNLFYTADALKSSDPPLRGLSRF